MESNRTVFANATIATAAGVRPGAVAVCGGVIDAVGNVEPRDGDRVVDCRGLCIMPGLVDVHVHLREPGYEYKETIAAGTAAAARGGYTTVCSMPNLRPVPDCPESLGVQLDAIRRTAVVRVVPYASITRGQKGAGELVDFESLAESVVGFSDDGKGVQEESLMREAMLRAKAVDRPIAAHCEVDELLRGGYIHDGGYCREHGHRGICSESEWAQVVRDVRLAAETGCRYHVCHVSTRESVEAVRRGKADGVRVTCETGPHYLLLCDDDLQEEGRFKMNPPLRSADDRSALIEGIADGTIEVVATDHAPHSAGRSRAVWNSVPWASSVSNAPSRCFIPIWCAAGQSRSNGSWPSCPRIRAASSGSAGGSFQVRRPTSRFSTSTPNTKSTPNASSPRAAPPLSPAGASAASACLRWSAARWHTAGCRSAMSNCQ